MRYTHAMIATEEPAGYRIGRKSGAAVRAGFWHRFEKTFKSLWQYAHLTDAVYRTAAWVDAPEHEVVAMYRLAERLGAETPIPDDARALRDWIDVSPDGALPDGASSLAWQVTPKWTTGGWKPDAIAALAAAAHEASPFERLAFVCARRDQGLALSVMEHLPHALVAAGKAALAPPAELPQWLAAIASAGALVTPDTGAAHAAGMLGVPVVDLFDPARFEQLSRQWRPWAAPSRCIVKPEYRDDRSAAAFGAVLSAALDDLSRSAGVAS
jgi:ADP-heptose:LPS heptosyltransferase